MKTLMTIAAVSALAVAMPAVAQNANANANTGVGTGITNRIVQLNTRLDVGIRQGKIDRREARTLQSQVRELSRLQGQYDRDGLTRQERRDLRQRIRDVHQRIRVADRGFYDRYERYGYNDSDYDNDRYAGAYGGYNNGYNGYYDGGYNEGAYVNNGYYGQGGPYEEAENCQTGSGVIGFIGRVLGRDDECGLEVGDRVTGNLYGVPTSYRNRYRDTGSVYYRSDGRNIYQIDTRTNTVLRVFPMNR